MLLVSPGLFSSPPRKRTRTMLSSVSLALFCVVLTACGGGSSSTSTPSTPSTPTPPPGTPTSNVTVALAPHLSAVTTSQPQTLTAALTGGTGTLLWYVDGIQNGNPSVGTIT